MRQYITLYPNSCRNIALLTGLVLYCFIIFLLNNSLFFLVSIITLCIFIYRNYQTVIQQDTWRYDVQNHQLLRCRWVSRHWLILESIPKNQIKGIYSENIYLDNQAQFGKIWLIGHHDEQLGLLARISPHKGRLSATENIKQTLAKKTQLPILAHHNHKNQSQNYHATLLPDDFQVASPPKIAFWVIMMYGFWAMFFCGLGAWLVLLYQGTSYPIRFLLLIFIILSWLYAISLTYRATKIMHHNQYWHIWQQQNPITSKPQRDTLLQRQSGKFVVFSLSKHILYSLLAIMLGLSLTFNIKRWENIPSALIIWFIIYTLLLDLWHNAFNNKKLIYDATQDTFSIYQLTLKHSWQIEKSASVNRFLGIECINNSLWLIAKDGMEHWKIGTASIFSNKTDKHIWLIAKKISVATGLPLLQQKYKKPDDLNNVHQ